MPAPLLLFTLLLAWLQVEPSLDPLQRLGASAFLAFFCPALFLPAIGWRAITHFSWCLLSAAAGWLLLGMIGVLAKRLGLPLLPLAFAALSLSLALFLLRGRDQDENRAERNPSFGERFGASAIVLLGLSLLLALSLAAGRGAYPGLFFIYENGVNLAQIHALLQDAGMPPLSLTYQGSRWPYYYASLEAVALLCRLTDLPVHQATFLLFYPLSGLAIAAVLYQLARKLAGPAPLLLILLLLITADQYRGTLWPTWRSVRALIGVIENGGFFLPTRLNFHYGHVATMGGVLLYGIVALALVKSNGRRDFALAATATAMLSAVKVFYFVPVAAWLAIVSLHEAGRLRAAPREALATLLPGLAALIFTLGWLWLNNDVDSLGPKLTFGLFLNAYGTDNALETLRVVTILFVPALLAILLTRRWPPFGEAGLWLLLALTPLIIVCGSGVSFAAYGNTMDFNWAQGLGVAPLAFGIAAAMLLSAAWPSERRAGALLVGLALLLACGSQMLRLPLLAGEALLNPQANRNWVLNEPIAEALRHIPRSGSLIVTNDYSYPARDANRTGHQSQISGLFGHRCYVCTPVNDANAPDIARRLAETALLAQPEWSPELADLAKARGWTHLLLNKAAPHAAELPLRKLFENERYLVFAF